MMRTTLIILTVFLFITVALNAYAERESVAPLIGSHFGEIVMIEAEFIAKPNTFRDQNIVSEPFLLSIYAVNGRVLKEPVVMEYDADTGMAGLESGKRYRLTAYETLSTEGYPRGWKEEASQFEYRLIHRIVIRPVGNGTGHTSEPVADRSAR
jgi:hypothetical protein